MNLENICVILDHPDEPRNIGSACRAMANNDIKKLRIVGKKSDYDAEKISVLAIHAFYIYENAEFFNSITEATEDCVLSFGTTRRRGKYRKGKLFLPEEFASLADEISGSKENPGGKVALVFGNERTGLTDSELSECTDAVTIPSSNEFGSLNLSHAVQIMCYHLFRKNNSFLKGYTPVSLKRLDETVSVISENLKKIGFFKVAGQNDMEKFWKIFDERLELCYRALMCRHNRLKGTLSDAAPILWQNGALARLEKGEPIDKLLYGGYSTISLGYAGLYECVKYMTGKSHTDPEATPFALDVMRYMNAACAKWKKENNMDFSLYGTPLESTTYKFAKCLQKRFGIIPGVTDKSYITNSYHIHVTENINAFDKLAFEAQFQALSPGGAISYVEVPDMQNNIDAVLELMKFIYDNIMYAELNTKSDYCQVCGYDGEIEALEDEDGKLVWTCPNCGNTDQSKLNVARRTCGYIGTQFWNQGRTQEIKERVLHL